ncbi:MAG: hypothetical protein C4567_13335 [Deltaproteobacteria bacterium]|nr:MAG: hypothetical protein C4567_13335 [Deltaproteobacteria bacterium]
MMRFAWREILIGLAVLTLFLAGPAWGKEAPDREPPPFTDYGSFLGEYQSAGAFKFYDNTEALLRLAQFEQSLMRYRFLKGQIQKKGDYRGLTAMVDLRLRFLKKQMHLHDGDIAAIPPRKARIPKAKPPEEKKKDAADKPKTPGPPDKDKAKAGPPFPGQAPGTVVIPGAPGTAGTAPAAVPGKPPEVVTTDTPPMTKEEKAAEAKEAKPPLPPNFWDRMWIRVNPWKKGAAPPPAGDAAGKTPG